MSIYWVPTIFSTPQIPISFDNTMSPPRLWQQPHCLPHLQPLSFSQTLIPFPDGASGKEPICQRRRHKRLGRQAWQPTPVFLLGGSHDRGAWRAIAHEVAKNWTWHSDLACTYTVLPQLDQDHSPFPKPIVAHLSTQIELWNHKLSGSVLVFPGPPPLPYCPQGYCSL